MERSKLVIFSKWMIETRTKFRLEYPGFFDSFVSKETGNRGDLLTNTLLVSGAVGCIKSPALANSYRPIISDAIPGDGNATGVMPDPGTATWCEIGTSRLILVLNVDPVM
jgi:hypothetical protein